MSTINFGSMQRTLGIIKPETLEKHGNKIMKEIASQEPPLKIVAEKEGTMSLGTVEKHYDEHKGKDFFKPLCGYMASGPSKAFVIEGEEAIPRFRKLVKEVLRPKYSEKTKSGEIQKNAVHASDYDNGIQAADREINIHFPGEKTNLDLQA